MRIFRVNDYKEMSRKAANIISAQIILKPDCVLGLATGSTPIGIYEQLAQWYKKGDLDFSEVTAVNLDEYKGLGRQDTQSYYYFMRKNLFDMVNILPANTYIPDGLNDDEAEECARYEKQLRRLGGIDLQLLGIGRNAHIGFNEPADSFAAQTHCVELQKSTLEANKRFFNSIDEMPKKAYTMGIGTIMQARKVLLVASGKDKAEALYNTVYGPITPKAPASVLQLHPDVTLVADKDALSMFPAN